MVCYMYYTDVFVGHNNINNLKNALKAELGSSVNSNDLDQLNALASGLKKFRTEITKGGSYESSYKNASWPECKQSGTCSCSSSCHSGSSVCDGSCCDNCDVKKAAKIFLGFLPCLYYALKYLNGKCKVDWSGQNISQDSSLGRFFVGMGYELQKLDEKKTGREISGLLKTLFNGSDGILDKIYKEVKKYFTSRFTSLVPSSTSSDSKPKPKTVRDILLWLYGLPFSNGFKDLLNHCERLCKPVENSLKFNDFKTYLFDSCFLLPVSVLGAIEEPTEEALENFPPYKSEILKFSYPEDPFKLFEKFCDFVRKIFVALIFLKFQCERPSDQAGWRDCAFGKTCAQKFNGDSSTSGSTSLSTPPCCSNSGPHGYLCTSVPGRYDVHEHCIKAGQTCRGLDSKCPDESNSNSKAHSSSQGCGSVGPCPHPLMRFLIDGSSESQSQASPSSPFRLPFSFAQLDFSQTPPVILDATSDNFLTMGFKDLPEKARQGNSIAPILNSFCGSNTSPLTKLFEFSLFVAMRPPETLIELIAFFLQFRLKLKSDLSSKFIDWISKEPGTPDGSALQKAIEKLDDFSGHRVSHPYDLQSLVGCDGPKGSGSPPTCGQYLYPLYNVAGVFDKEFCAVYLSYVCHLAPKLKALLEKFHEEAKGKFSCCSASCKIVECPCALPFFYSFGFSFWSPNTLNCPGHEGHSTGQDQYCTRKTCKNFLDQLKNVLEDPQSTLLSLIAEIESFLWSIRKPFFFGFLYVWFFVLSYFCYVILIKLDTVHTGSHLHLPRSFKILPSTLFSDASSKLKDLSYFTL